MPTGPESQLIADISSGLRGTFLEGELILGGSSGLFGFPTKTPAFTEDLGFLVREDLVIARGKDVIDVLGRLGFQRTPDTPTFTSPAGRPSISWDTPSPTRRTTFHRLQSCRSWSTRTWESCWGLRSASSAHPPAPPRSRRPPSASSSRRAMGPLFWKYLDVVPAVFSASGELFAFRLIAPRAEVLAGLRRSAVLTLDSATEALADFRFGKARNDYAYFASVEEALAVAREGLGRRLEGTSFPFAWTPPDREMLFAVVTAAPPASREVHGHRVVTTERLVRDLMGIYGLRGDLVALIEARLGGYEGREG